MDFVSVVSVFFDRQGGNPNLVSQIRHNFGVYTALTEGGKQAQRGGGGIPDLIQN